MTKNYCQPCFYNHEYGMKQIFFKLNLRKYLYHYIIKIKFVK